MGKKFGETRIEDYRAKTKEETIDQMIEIKGLAKEEYESS